MSSATYVGTKIVNATPMNRQAYNDLRGWIVPADENPADEGYLVEYQDGGQANHPSYKGYISWSPKEVFERSYRFAKKSSLSTVDSEKLETLRELITRLPPEEQLSIKVACKQIDDVLTSMEGNACIVLALVSAPYAGLQ